MGILSMATGSGKTYTSLKAIESTDANLITIIVPSIDLTNQWEKEIIREYGEKYYIRKANSKIYKWEDKIKLLINAIKHDNDKKGFILTTMQTASSLRFLKLYDDINPSKHGVIVDEVHRSGAKSFQNIFALKSKYRLGLSATPERPWDDYGNQVIFEYFGPIVFKYNLSDAIFDGRLSEYKYYTHFVSLIEEEREKFYKVSKSIALNIQKINKRYPNTRSLSVPKLLQFIHKVDKKTSNLLRSLYLKRVKIIKKASNKGEELKKILNDFDFNKCLVYCNDLHHIDECINIIHDSGNIPIEFSSRVDSDIRQKILKDLNNNKREKVLLVAVKCLDEGIDIPACDSAILISSSRSDREFIQRRGRVLRKHPTKEYSVIHDIVVLPFTQGSDAYPLTLSEYNYVRQELNRVGIFVSNSLNKEIDIKKMLNYYKSYVYDKVFEVEQNE